MSSFLKSNIPFPEYGLRDKGDGGEGLELDSSNNKRIVLRKNLIFVDSRDCVGEASLKDAQSVYLARGGKKEVAGNVITTTGLGVSPITITVNVNLSSNNVTNGDSVTISGVAGNTNANGSWKITNVISTFFVNRFDLVGSIGNGNYAGSGLFIRPADQGYPSILNTTSTILGNVLTVQMTKRLKVIRNISIVNTTIPRDIIPLTVYLPDFIEFATPYSTDNLPTCSQNPITWESYILQEKIYLSERILGYYSSPLDIYRTYNYGSFPLPNQYTPAPLVLWNPPVGVWPLQLKPYPFQTVPTYRSKNFIVTGRSGVFYSILAGYGVYDMSDWTDNYSPSTALQLINTQIGRWLLLLLCIPPQSYRDEDYINLVINSNVYNDPPLPVASYFGFGDYQRFIPGPGLGQAYQPATVNGGDPTVSSADSPIPFPNFRGNVWGPYDTPGDRFQKLGLRDVVQDLYLNGDTKNLLGMPLVKPYVPTECVMRDYTYGFNFPLLNEVNMGNFDQSTNPNILNSMRIVPNGFGAVSQQKKGDGILPYQNRYQSAGGIGPDIYGPPVTPQTLTSGTGWVNNPINNSSANGSFSYGIAGAPLSGLATTGTATNPTIVPQVTDAELSGNETNPPTAETGVISHRISYYDIGANAGQFVTQMSNYRTWVINEMPDTNIVLNIQQSQRQAFIQSTNPITTECMLSVPIRLNLGTNTGTLQYVESVESLLSSPDYWSKRFIAPLASLYKLDIAFTTYDGTPIPLEKMLQSRRSVQLLNNYQRIFGSIFSFKEINPRSVALAFLFDPVNPDLGGRAKRTFSMAISIDTYEYDSPGLYLNMIKDMLEKDRDNYDDNTDSFVVRASNYNNYSSS